MVSREILKKERLRKLVQINRNYSNLKNRKGEYWWGWGGGNKPKENIQTYRTDFWTLWEKARVG